MVDEIDNNTKELIAAPFKETWDRLVDEVLRPNKVKIQDVFRYGRQQLLRLTSGFADEMRNAMEKLEDGIMLHTNAVVDQIRSEEREAGKNARIRSCHDRQEEYMQKAKAFFDELKDLHKQYNHGRIIKPKAEKKPSPSASEVGIVKVLAEHGREYIGRQIHAIFGSELSAREISKMTHYSASEAVVKGLITGGRSNGLPDKRALKALREAAPEDKRFELDALFVAYRAACSTKPLDKGSFELY